MGIGNTRTLMSNGQTGVPAPQPAFAIMHSDDPAGRCRVGCVSHVSRWGGGGRAASIWCFPHFTWDSQLVICFGLCSTAWAAAAFLITLNMHMGVWNHTGNKLVTSSAPNQRARQHPTFSPTSPPPSSPDSLDQPQEGNYISLGWPSTGKQAPTGLVLGEDEDSLWGRLKKCKSLPQIREVTYPRLFGRLKV